jgi:filamentous hemagglutinin family protein
MLNFKKTLIMLSVSTTLAGTLRVTQANPVLANVETGNATVSQTATTTVINQTSQQAIINWNSFNIAAGEKTQFVQPTSSSIALNRINPSQGASQIYGSLSANGKIILVNGAGIHFGPGSMVNVSGIIASTSDISSANFLSANYNFNMPSAYAGSIVNEGSIIAAQHGLVALLGNTVQNNGMIQAEMGSIVLGTGNKFTLDFYGDQLVNFTVNEGASSGGRINNTGTLLADGGKILVTAKAAANVLDNVIDMQGVAQARSVYNHNGVIILSGNGAVSVSGRLNVSGRHHRSTGGTIQVLGQYVHLLSAANVNASGSAGGGTILIGGNYQGRGSEQNALTTTVDAGAVINASALNNGTGGNVVVWSNEATRFSGAIVSKGGAQGGNGGSVEVSGQQRLDFNGHINLSAAKGTPGTLLLDPENLTIQASGPSTTTVAMSGYTSNVDSSILTVSDLQAALANASVVVQTGTGGSQAGDITVANSISWSTGNTLTLSAYHNIVINSGVTINNSAPGGGLILQANNSGAFVSAATGGTVTNNGTLTLGGTVNIFYNPTSYSVPITYNNTGAGVLTAFMLINSLGVQSDPTSVLSLGALSNPANSSIWSSNFALSNSINAASTASGAGWSIAGLSPIGNDTIAFTGAFNGQNYTISNLYIYQPNQSSMNVGLFGTVGASTLGISNLSLATVDITGGAAATGALVGNNSSTAPITNISVSGTVTNSHADNMAAILGGIVGIDDSGVISNSHNSSAVTIANMGADAVGGIAGVMVTSAAVVRNTFNTGTISGGSQRGGIVGYNQAGLITQSFNAGTIQENGSYQTGFENVGGIVGGCNGQISLTYNEGSITGNSTSNVYAGGIMGGGNAFISDSYNLGSVTSNTLFGFIGGIAGEENQTISNSYNVGAVSGNQPFSHIGAIAGESSFSNSAISNTFWDPNTVGNWNGTNTNNGADPANIVNLTPKTAAELQTQSTFTTAPASWDFTNTWGIAAGSMPYLLALGPSATNRIISGTAPTGNTVYLANNGSFIASEVVSAGTFSFSVSTALVHDSQALLIYGNNASGNIITLAPANGADLTGLALATNILQVGDTNTHTLANSILESAYSNGLTGGDNVLYTATGYNLTLLNNAFLETTPTTPYNLNGNISTAVSGSTINFEAPVTLGATSTITSGSGDVTFNSTVNGANSLAIISSGVTTFASSVNVASFSTGAGGALHLNGSGITTGGTQSYDENIFLNPASTSVTLNGASLTFASGVSIVGASNKNLNLLANDVLMLRMITLSGAGSVTASTSGGITVNNAISAAGGITLLSSTAGIVLNAILTANTAGKDIILSGQGFTNNVGSSALETGAGNFLVWSANPAKDTVNGLAYNFIQYNAIYGITAVAGVGNGLLYTSAIPIITLYRNKSSAFALLQNTRQPIDAGSIVTLSKPYSVDSSDDRFSVLGNFPTQNATSRVTAWPAQNYQLISSDQDPVFSTPNPEKVIGNKIDTGVSGCVNLDGSRLCVARSNF